MATSSTPVPTPATIITHAELTQLLGGVGGRFFSLTWVGKDKPRYVRDKGRITKVSTYGGQSTPNSYRNAKARATDTPPEEVVIADVEWLEHVGGPVSAHNGYSKNRKTGEVTYDSPKKGEQFVTFFPTSGHTDYTLDGAPCQRGDVADMLPKSRPPKEGSVDNFRRLALEGVSGARISGVDYMVVADPREVG